MQRVVAVKAAQQTLQTGTEHSLRDWRTSGLRQGIQYGGDLQPLWWKVWILKVGDGRGMKRKRRKRREESEYLHIFDLWTEDLFGPNQKWLWSQTNTVYDPFYFAYVKCLLRWVNEAIKRFLAQKKRETWLQMVWWGKYCENISFSDILWVF